MLVATVAETSPVARYPFPDGQPTLDVDRWGYIPIGVKLDETGQPLGLQLVADFGRIPYVLIEGAAGSGKTSAVRTLMAGAIGRGWELAVCATDSLVDLDEWRPYVPADGWGGDLTSACSVIDVVYRESRRRLEKGGPWRPLLFVIDELTGLMAAEDVPGGFVDTEPAREIAERNRMRTAALDALVKLVRHARATRIVLAVTAASARTPTGLRTGARFLLGGHSGAYIQIWPKGTGAYQLGDQAHGIVQWYYASPEEYGAWLEAVMLPKRAGC